MGDERTLEAGVTLVPLTVIWQYFCALNSTLEQATKAKRASRVVALFFP